MTDACPPFVNMRLLVELFPDRHPVTVYRWRNGKGRNRLPEPDVIVAGDVALWSLPTIKVWAAERKLELDAGVLARIAEDQG